MNEFNKVLNEHKHYIRSIAYSLNNKEYFDDLISIGNMTLYNCWLKYDFKKGIPFTQFSGKFIRFAMIDFLTKYSRTIRLPDKKVRKVLKDEFTEDKKVSIDNIQLSYIEDNETDYMGFCLNKINELSETKRLIFEMRYGINCKKQLTIDEISERLKIDKTKIHKILYYTRIQIKNSIDF